MSLFSTPKDAWVCQECDTTNVKYIKNCKKCDAPKPEVKKSDISELLDEYGSLKRKSSALPSEEPENETAVITKDIKTHVANLNKGVTSKLSTSSNTNSNPVIFRGTTDLGYTYIPKTNEKDALIKQNKELEQKLKEAQHKISELEHKLSVLGKTEQDQDQYLLNEEAKQDSLKFENGELRNQGIVLRMQLEQKYNLLRFVFNELAQTLDEKEIQYSDTAPDLLESIKKCINMINEGSQYS